MLGPRAPALLGSDDVRLNEPRPDSVIAERPIEYGERRSGSDCRVVSAPHCRLRSARVALPSGCGTGLRRSPREERERGRAEVQRRGRLPPFGWDQRHWLEACASELAPGRGPDSAWRRFDLDRREALLESCASTGSPAQPPSPPPVATSAATPTASSHTHITNRSLAEHCRLGGPRRDLTGQQTPTSGSDRGNH
jgi:hypothetical protein